MWGRESCIYGTPTLCQSRFSSPAMFRTVLGVWAYVQLSHAQQNRRRNIKSARVTDRVQRPVLRSSVVHLGFNPFLPIAHGIISAKSVSPFENLRDFLKPSSLNSIFMICVKSIDYPPYNLMNIFLNLVRKLYSRNGKSHIKIQRNGFNT